MSDNKIIDSRMSFFLRLRMQMDELACFAPGMLALGSFGYESADSQKLFSLAEEVY